jgi:hypothetical protein
MEFPNTTCNLDLLNKDFKASALAAKYVTASKLGTTLYVQFTEALTQGEEETATTVVTTHSANFTSSFDYQFITSQYSQSENIAFGQKLLQDWMRKNTLEGMSVRQSLWVFSRFETFELVMTFGTKKFDIFKMFYAGALPTLYYCLLRITPDDMTESYHWVNSDRLNWVKARLEEKLGAGMTAYIQSLGDL